MDSTVIGAIIAATASVSGVLITKYSDEIKNLFVRGKNNDYLVGSWCCEWATIAPPSLAATKLADQANVEKVSGNLLKGYGTTPEYGKWLFEGKVFEFAVVLSYTGEKVMKDVPGTVILKKDSPVRLQGSWMQYATDGTVHSGTTVWKKI